MTLINFKDTSAGNSNSTMVRLTLVHHITTLPVNKVSGSQQVQPIRASATKVHIHKSSLYRQRIHTRKIIKTFQPLSCPRGKSITNSKHPKWPGGKAMAKSNRPKRTSCKALANSNQPKRTSCKALANSTRPKRTSSKAIPNSTRPKRTSCKALAYSNQPKWTGCKALANSTRPKRTSSKAIPNSTSPKRPRMRSPHFNSNNFLFPNRSYIACQPLSKMTS